jgi:hypothetical protein
MVGWIVTLDLRCAAAVVMAVTRVCCRGRRREVLARRSGGAVEFSRTLLRRGRAGGGTAFEVFKPLLQLLA